MSNVPITVYVPPKVKALIKDLAWRQRVSQGSLVAAAVEMFKVELSFMKKEKSK